jgi:hypothetical protein
MASEIAPVRQPLTLSRRMLAELRLDDDAILPQRHWNIELINVAREFYCTGILDCKDWVYIRMVSRVSYGDLYHGTLALLYLDG